MPLATCLALSSATARADGLTKLSFVALAVNPLTIGLARTEDATLHILLRWNSGTPPALGNPAELLKGLEVDTGFSLTHNSLHELLRLQLIIETRQALGRGEAAMSELDIVRASNLQFSHLMRMASQTPYVDLQNGRIEAKATYRDGRLKINGEDASELLGPLLLGGLASLL